ncbi:MarR family winged helix-turn-helix transcriptional regulator [Sphingosinicella rhizophila]|uniref:MarR family transcriptional regulator n=1 Tax=Sphingosinicella rhizophila TaxID=3050082 RepID=A0ABU3Q842_9SPHN|nr:winged helix DNA-binding protein [Sphingosinicella sp. GR2756]MDT9599574.1 MarR family transcriptional regulator [Sphingosinicella sp. GR2756]
MTKPKQRRDLAKPEPRAAQTRRRKRDYEVTSSLPDPLDLARHLPFKIAVLSNLLRIDRDPFVRRITDLAARELRVLLNIGTYMPVRAADIAYQSRLDTHMVSRAVTTLVERDLVVIRPDDKDRRQAQLGLTESGERLYRSVADIMATRAAKLSTILDAGEADMLADMLERLEDRAEELLAEEIDACLRDGAKASADQRELLRWYRKGSNPADQAGAIGRRVTGRTPRKPEVK